MKPTIRFTLLAATALALAACSSTSSTSQLPGETVRSVVHKEGVPGGVILETTTFSAAVTAVDPTSHTLTLALKDGQKKTIKCGPEVVNFDQIHTGDQVTAIIKSELTVALADAGALPVDTSVAQLALPPKGDKPGGIMTETQDYTATVTVINQRRREVTLLLPDDTTRTLAVRPDIDLSQHRTGEKVAIRVVVAVAIAVE